MLAQPADSARSRESLRWIVKRDLLLPSELSIERRADADEYLACLEGSTTLSQLIIVNIIEASGLSAAGFLHLNHCVNLSTLNFESIFCPDVMWKRLQDETWNCFRTLTTLRFYFTDIGDQGLGILATECQLMADFSADAQCLPYLPSMPELQEVCIEPCDDMTDASVGFLSHIPKLRKLELNYKCPCADAVLQQLMKVPTLRELAFMSADNLTSVGFGYIAEDQSAD